MDANQGSRKAFLLVFLVFVLGIALGAVGHLCGDHACACRAPAGRPRNSGQYDGHVYQGLEPDSGPAETNPGDPERHARALRGDSQASSIPNMNRSGTRAGSESGRC